MKAEDIVAVVLAGGEGRRIGGGKPGLMLGGRTLLDRALERAEGYAAKVGIAVRAQSQIVAPTGVTLLTDDPSIAGPLSGIASALAFAKQQGAAAVLTLPCDAPFLPDDLAMRLAEALTPGLGVAVAKSGRQWHPICALWRAGLDQALRTYAATGRGSLMGLAEAVGWTPVDWIAEPVDPFFNINSREDLAGAEKLLTTQ